jgi:hypothetical protein
MAGDFGSYDHYVYAVLVVVGTFAAVIGLLWLSQRSRYAAAIASCRGIAQNFMSVVSVLFALNLAFLAHDTWSAHDRALDIVYQEAGHLSTLVALAAHLPEAERDTIAAAVRAYAAATVGDEWPKLAHRQSSGAAAAAADNLLSVIATGAVGTEGGIRSRMLEEAISVRSDRDLRIALSQTHVNPLKWLGMAFLGLLTMVSIAMVHVGQTRAEFLAVMIFAAAAAPTAAIILVHGNPFQQPAAVSAAPIAALVHPAVSGRRA